MEEEQQPLNENYFLGVCHVTSVSICVYAFPLFLASRPVNLDSEEKWV